MSINPNRDDENLARQASGASSADSVGDDDAFSKLAGQEDPGLVREFIDFLRYNKKWWLTPIFVVTLFLIGAAILLPSPVAPFIYTLF